MDKYIKAVFNPGDRHISVPERLSQWDVGLVLQITGLTLPETTEVHFANSGDMDALRVIAKAKDGVTEATIPNEILQSSGTAYAYVYVTDAESSRTEYKINLYINRREKPQDYAPENQPDVIGQLRQEISGKVDKYQGTENKGRVLVVGEDGNVVPGNAPSGEGGSTNNEIVNTMRGDSPLVIPDSAEMVSKGFGLTGNTVQNQDPPPSPSNPQEIKSVGKWNEEKQKYEVDVKVVGKNLLDIEKAEIKNNWMPNDRLNGYSLLPILVGKDADVTVSIPKKIPLGSGMYLSVCSDEHGSNAKWIAHSTNSSLNNLMVAQKATSDYISICVLNANILNFKQYFSKLQIEYGVDNTDFEPYKEQSITITSDRPITKWDNLVEQNGEIGWLYKSRIAEIPKTGYVLRNASESRYGVYFLKEAVFKDAIVTNGSPEKDSNIFTHLKCGNPYTANGNIAWLYVAGGNAELRIKVDDEAINTVELFEQYISDKDIKILYETESAKFIPLQKSEQYAIRALKTYYPTTVITADGGEIAPSVEISYVADTKNYIDNKFRQLSKATCNLQAQNYALIEGLTSAMSQEENP